MQVLSNCKYELFSTGKAQNFDFFITLENLDNDDSISFSNKTIVKRDAYDMESKEIAFNMLPDVELREIHRNKQFERYKQESNADICPCGGGFRKCVNGMEIECEKCGRCLEHDSTEVDESSGVSNDARTSYSNNQSASPLKVAGPGAGHLQKRLICQTADYKKTQLKNTMDQMLNYVDRYDKKKLPEDMAKMAAHAYYEIQKHGIIKRGDVRAGIMAACLSRMCDKHGTPKKRAVFIEMFRIQHEDLSKGEKILDELLSSGLLSAGLFLNQNQVETQRIRGFLIEYFLQLGIPLPGDLGITSSNIKVQAPGSIEYFYFTEKLVKFTIKLRVASSSIPSTKCAGSICILCNRFAALNITEKDISLRCKISMSTVKRFYNTTMELLKSNEPRNHRLKKKLVHLFKKYRIPTD